MKKLSVIHLMPSFGMGGAEQLVLDLASRLPAHGVRSKVVALFDGGSLEERFRERGIPHELFHRRDPFGISTVWDLYRLFRRERPDIVHTHLFGADAWGRLAAFLARIPVVVSTEHNVNPGYSWAQRAVNWLFAKGTDAFVAVSGEVKRNMVARDRLPDKKVRVILNGVDFARLVDRPRGSFHDVPRLLTIGRLMEQKGHKTLLDALACVPRPWSLDVVGAGPLERALRREAEHSGISSRIHWHGVQYDVARYYSGADVFCFPSQWEGLGLAALEAALSGVPVIVSDIPPMRELLREDEAVFVPPQDVQAWVEAIEHVLSHPADALERAVRARGRLRGVSSIEKTVEAYVRLYRSL